METTLKTEPTLEPVSLDESKQHLRIDLDDTDSDDYVTGLITVSRIDVESILWRKLITQTWYAYLDDWPVGDYIELPFGKLQSVTAIKYTNVSAVEATWTSSEYIVGTDYLKGRVTLADGYNWPNVVLYASNPIEVESVCGYGATRASVPGPIKHAMKIMMAELFENREPSIVGTTYAKIDTVNNLLAKYGLSEL